MLTVAGCSTNCSSETAQHKGFFEAFHIAPLVEVDSLSLKLHKVPKGSEASGILQNCSVFGHQTYRLRCVALLKNNCFHGILPLQLIQWLVQGTWQ